MTVLVTAHHTMLQAINMLWGSSILPALQCSVAQTTFQVMHEDLYRHLHA